MVKRPLFGTSGIRGHAEKLFTDQFCFDIGRTFVKFLDNHNIKGDMAVGIDPRDSSPRIQQALFKGLATGNTKLFDEGITPIPSMNWVIKNTPVKASIMITGSHIAPELNGVKFYAHDEEVSIEDQKKIEAIYEILKNKLNYPTQNPLITKETRAKELYIKLLRDTANNGLPKWKVALDCANGAQSVVIPELFSSLGFEVVKVNCDTDKAFIARDTDTDDKAEVEDLKKKVISENCDFGVAFDGDGDRVVFIDEKGAFVQGEYSCSLIAKEFPSEHLVTTISASQVVDTLGKKVVRTKVGSPYVVGKMKELKAPFGFEPNGGAVFAKTMMTRDGGTMAVNILNLFSKFDGTFSEMIAQLPKFYMFRTKVDYKWELKDKIISEAKKEFKGVKIEEIDGLKIWIDRQTWILFRSSANAPEFRVFAESKSENKAKDLLNSGVAFVNELVK